MDEELGTRGPSGSDESFTSWAGRQIEKLSSAVQDIQQDYFPESGFKDLIDRVRALEKSEEVEWGNHLARRVDRLGNRVTDVARRVTEESNRINVLRELHHDHVKWASTSTEDWARANRLFERITALENGSRLVGTGGLVEQIITRLEALEAQNEEPVLQQVGTPWVGENFQKVERDFSTTSNGPDVMHVDLRTTHEQIKAAYDQGRVKGQTEGRESALGEYQHLKDRQRESLLAAAERRIRRYMSRSFSSATVEGVVRELNDWRDEAFDEPEGRTFGRGIPEP